MLETVVIRVRRETRDLLHELAREDGATAIDMLERLIRETAEARLRRAVVSDLSSPAGTESELVAWDTSLADGLDPDENFSAWR